MFSGARPWIPGLLAAVTTAGVGWGFYRVCLGAAEIRGASATAADLLVCCGILCLLASVMCPIGLGRRRLARGTPSRDADARRAVMERAGRHVPVDLGAEAVPAVSAVVRRGSVDRPCTPETTVGRVPESASMLAGGVGPGSIRLSDATGHGRFLRFLVREWNGAEEVAFDGRVLTIVSPMKPHEVLLALSPLALGIIGGLVGAGLGFVSAALNTQLIRSTNPAWLRLGLSLGSGVIAFASWYAIAHRSV
jgi:hypothetical protein